MMKRVSGFIGGVHARYLIVAFLWGIMLATSAFGETHKFTVTLNYSGAAVTNMPTLLKISTASIGGFDYSAAGDGTHFEITDENGAILPYEIDTWNPSGVSLLWVKVPIFAGGKHLTVTYGRTDEDMTTRAAEVWSNYIGVWHMNAVNASGKYPNSAGDARFDGEISSFSRAGEAGKFGQSVLILTNATHTCDHEKGGVFIPDNGNLDLSGDFTISGWFKHTSVDRDSTWRAFCNDILFTKRAHPQTGNAANEGSTDGFGIYETAWGATFGQLAAYGSEANWGGLNIWPSVTNGFWTHFAISFSGGNAYSRTDGEGRTSPDIRGPVAVGSITDNDLPLAIGNAGKAYLDGDGVYAWGGCVDEVRLRAGTHSADYLAAEYAAMTGGAVCNSETCSLTIDQNEHFDDTVNISSDIPAAANGGYYAGTTITLTAAPNATGTFRKWYGDVPQESCTNATISFVITRDTWVYARFVHPWTLAADKTWMTDGHFKVNVSVQSNSGRRLIVGKAKEAGLPTDDDTGTGTVDLGGPIWLEGDDTPWTIRAFNGNRGCQSFPIARTNEVPFRYLSPGTVTNAATTQLFHRGESESKAYGAPYTMIIVDEPADALQIGNWCFNTQSQLDTLIMQLPNVTALNGYVVLDSTSLAKTRFDWWDLSSVASISTAYFMKYWGRTGSLRRRVPVGGALSLPNLRGVDWLVEQTYEIGGTQLYLMENVEELSLGGATEETTVTNLCTYAFAGDSSLKKLTLHAAADMQVGTRIFADHTYGETNKTDNPYVYEGVTYSRGSNTAKGRVPDVIHFTGPAISATAIANLLDVCPAVTTAAKPVAIYVSKYQSGWWGVGKADWISTPTAAERAAYPGKQLIGVYRAGGEAPSGKAVIIHQGNEWDKASGFVILVR